tara:strand:- start:7214 stop:7426 length:213 start_codon:yes stop_codon:yes gene_type:complete
MRLVIHNSEKLTEHQIRETVAKMIGRKGYQVYVREGKYYVKDLDTKDKQEFIKTLVIRWCDRQGIECSIR